MSAAAPGRVLRLALVAWGLGHLALGRPFVAAVLFAAEIAGAALVSLLTLALAGSTHYLVPFLSGVAFIGAWGWQAVAAYRAAQQPADANAPAPLRSPATAAFWLAIPLLAWGAGFWVAAAREATPAAVVDRFLADWTRGRLDAGGWPAGVVRSAKASAATLVRLCEAQALRAGCNPEVGDHFRDLRIRLDRHDAAAAEAVAEAVRFERRGSTVLGLFAGGEMLPVPVERVMTLRLRSETAPLLGVDIGARRWRLTDADAGTAE